MCPNILQVCGPSKFTLPEQLLVVQHGPKENITQHTYTLKEPLSPQNILNLLNCKSSPASVYDALPLKHSCHVVSLMQSFATLYDQSPILPPCQPVDQQGSMDWHYILSCKCRSCSVLQLCTVTMITIITVTVIIILSIIIIQ